MPTLTLLCDRERRKKKGIWLVKTLLANAKYYLCIRITTAILANGKEKDH